MPRKKTHEEFVAQVEDVSKGEYKVIGTYTYANDNIEMYHTECGNNFFIRANNFLQGKRCPACKVNRIKKAQRKPQQVVEKQLSERHNGSIILVDNYINTHTKVKFKCLNCNTTFEAEPNSVLRLSGCPTCKIPKGEKLISDYLESRCVRFTRQKRFKDCKSKRTLMFDFYLLDLNILIEYDGLQHFKPIEYFGGEEAFEDQKKRDEIKNNFSKTSGIPLIRIPYKYTKDKVIKVLDEILGSVPSQESKAERPSPKGRFMI